MAALSLPQLSLRLPSSRMSVNFDTSVTDLNTFSTPVLEPSTNRSVSRIPLPSTNGPVQRCPIPHGPSLSEVKEEPETSSSASSRQKSFKWSFKSSDSERLLESIQSAYTLSRISSSASTMSTPSTAATSVFSSAPTPSTARTSYNSTTYSSPYQSSKISSSREATSLSSLPLSLIEHILSYALSLPQTVSLGPHSSHTLYGYHRQALYYVDLRQILTQPVFLVSRQIREVALDIFYRKCDFSIDLSSIYYTKIASTIDEYLKKHQRYWVTGPPKVVRDTLQNLSRLHIRLPVASTDAVQRGRGHDNWMDGSDGKGGGSWKVKSMKSEQEDAVAITKCLEAVVSLVMTTPGGAPEPQGLTPSTRSSVRHSRSVKSERSKSAEYDRCRRCFGPDEAETDGKRKPLKRLEITLVKRNPWAIVLPESLGLIQALRSVPVSRFTKYHFESERQKVTWATKYRNRWQGMEPDCKRLLQDLQGLTVAERPIEPIQTPTEFKFVKLDKGGQPRLSDSAIPKTPIVLDRPKMLEKSLPDLPPPPTTPKVRRKPLDMFKRKTHKRVDSFTMTSGRNEPPTIEELKKIAEDIRNGLY